MKERMKKKKRERTQGVVRRGEKKKDV